MELVSQCFVEHAGALAKSLLRADFSIDQVGQFLPEAASVIYISTQKNSLFQTMASLLAESPSHLFSKVDVDAIAQNAGMNSMKVAAGLHAIAPILLQAFGQKHHAQIYGANRQG